MKCDGNHPEPKCLDKQCWRSTGLHHRVRHERDSSGSYTLARTHCGQLVYKYGSTDDWEQVDCGECWSQRTLVA